MGITAFRSAQATARRRRRYGALIALNEAALDRWVEAYRGLDEALRADDDPWLTRHDAMLRAELARIRQRVPLLQITGAPTGATVTVDGAAVGPLPLAREVAVMADQSTAIELRADGFVTQRRVVTASAGELRVVHVELAERRGELRLHGLPPGATVSLDGGPRRPAEDVTELSADEEHELTFRAHGYASQERRMSVHAGEQRDITVALSPSLPVSAYAAGLRATETASEPAPHAAAWNTRLTIGLALGTAVTATGFLVGAYEWTNSSDNHCRSAGRYSADCAGGLDDTGALLYGLGAAALFFGGGATIYRAVWDGRSSRRSSTGVGVRPLLGLRSAGLEVVW